MSEFKQECDDLRGRIQVTEQCVRALMEDPIFQEGQTPTDVQYRHGEVKANIMLAVRHLEDASMRLGKAIQWSDDGISIYDKKGEKEA